MELLGQRATDINTARDGLGQHGTQAAALWMAGGTLLIKLTLKLGMERLDRSCRFKHSKSMVGGSWWKSLH
jgi:hypothetical protein